MKIIFISEEYPPFSFGGGAGIYAQKITEWLSKMGHEILVITSTTRKNNNFKEKSLSNGIRVIPIKLPKIFGSSFFFWASYRKLLKNYAKQFDIIHYNGPHSYSIFGDFSSIEIPQVLTVHHQIGDLSNILYRRYLERVRGTLAGESNIVYKYLEKRAVQNCDKIITVSHFTKKKLISLYNVDPNKIHVIYNGRSWMEDINNINNITLDDNIKRLLNQYWPILLFVGRIDDPRKGLDILIHSINILVNKFNLDNLKLIIVGKGDKTKLYNIANQLGVINNLYFYGYASLPILKSLYQVSDIFIYPSRFEGFGLTLIEAMSVGVPIITTNVGAIPEIIPKHVHIVKPDPEQLAIAIMNLLNNLNKERAVAQSIFRKYALKFTWKESTIQHIQVYRELLH